MTESLPESLEAAEEERGGITPRQSILLLGASVVTAASALLATIIAKHTLESEPLEEFLLFWSILFGIFGIVAGIQQETTRAVGAAKIQQKLHQQDAGLGARVMPVAFGIGAVIGVLVLASSPLWGAKYLPTDTASTVILVAVGVALYALHAAMSGAAGGRESWTLFAALGGGEALWRLVAMLAVAFLVKSLFGLEIAVVSTVLLWALIVLFSREGRLTFAARADVAAWPFTKRILLAMGSSAASAVLMMGFPIVLKASQGGDEATTETKVLLSMLILAISICRSPIMIPLQQFQGVAISAFLKQKHRPVAAMMKPVAALLGIGLVGAGAAWLLGPWLFRLIYPPKANEVAVYDHYLTGWLLAALVFGSAIMALLVLSGTAVIALDAHRLYIVGWVVAALVAIALAFLPVSLVARTLIALYAGPALGFLTHLGGMVAVARADKK